MTDTSGTGHEPSKPSPADSATPSQRPAAGTTPTRPGARQLRTRAGATWVGIIVFAAVLVLLLIFILQNTQAVEISYFTASGQVSLAVAMLLAAVAGVLLTAIAGSLRIWQLRRDLRRSARR
ncbi:hypothetical protein GCM10012275_44360 [Longimycelium tulufanense]|uniref:Lipopolysaccharide assembly protein A domain-containing protein n=1 Tax=Longimycelium tulufanense TaxID=907463 RepID=A0A8J3FXK6_9PSEU|nr:lipopolysaccharide assembly protein LapA domain-containing protein [Longimycelium tulufanense]GGM69071.1 hypothetical protein GCM10012275_44360 [Longimycelium tulufanense]